MIPNKSECLGTIWIVSKHIWNVSNIRNILKCFGIFIGNFFLELSCNQFFKTLEFIPNKSEHFGTLLNIPIFWTVSKQISGTFHVNNFQEYFEMFPTNHNVSKHSKIFTNKSAIYSKKIQNFLKCLTTFRRWWSLWKTFYFFRTLCGKKTEAKSIVKHLEADLSTFCASS